MPSYEKLPNGNWAVRFRRVENGVKRNKKLSEWDGVPFAKKKDAERGFREFANKYGLEEVSKPYNYKYDVLLDKYLKYNSVSITEQSQYDKGKIFARFITPYFSGKDIDAVTKTELHDWQEHLWTAKDKDGKRYSFKYLKKIRINLNSFLSYCESKYGITNLLKSIPMPKDTSTPKNIVFWEVSDFNRFIGAVDNILWQTLFSMLFYTGMRIGEAQALSDNDFKRNNIYITKTLINKTVDNTYYKIQPYNKNKKAYDKPVPDTLAFQIQKYLDWKQQNKIDGQYLFGGTKPLDDNTIKRYLDKYINAYNITAEKPLKRITPHGFRHSYVSLLISLDMGTKTVAELIGDREEQVIKTYSHLYSDKKQSVIDRINSFLCQNQGTNQGTKSQEISVADSTE